MRSFVLAAGALAALAVAAGCRSASPAPAAGEPAAAPLPVLFATEPIGEDADDPALWRNATDPARSLILGNNKAPAPAGGIAAFDLDGRRVQWIGGLDRPNNVDVEYGFTLGGRAVDLAVATERYRRRLRVFTVEAGPVPLRDVSSPQGLEVFHGEAGERGAPMGVGLYRRPTDGVVFAFVSRKESALTGALWQYRLEDDGSGRVRAVKVRELGHSSPGQEIEAVFVDDNLGFVYYAEERVGLHKWHADPDHPEAARELAVFGREVFRLDREGLALYATGPATGYLIATDQIKGGSRYLLFPREGLHGEPHAHPLLRAVAGGADDTDGLDATSEALGPRFPRGLVIAMNSRGRNFHAFAPASLGLGR